MHIYANANPHHKSHIRFVNVEKVAHVEKEKKAQKKKKRRQKSMEKMKECESCATSFSLCSKGSGGGAVYPGVQILDLQFKRMNES